MTQLHQSTHLSRYRAGPSSHDAHRLVVVAQSKPRHGRRLKGWWCLWGQLSCATVWGYWGRLQKLPKTWFILKSKAASIFLLVIRLQIHLANIIWLMRFHFAMQNWWTNTIRNSTTLIRNNGQVVDGFRRCEFSSQSQIDNVSHFEVNLCC